VTSIRIVTVSGGKVTQTVTSTPSLATAASSSDDLTTSRRKALSGGAIAGAVIGSLFGVALLLLGACFLWRRKKHNDDAEVARRSPRRNTSVLSKTGLLSRGRPTTPMAEKEPDEPMHTQVGTGGSSARHSMMFGSAAAAMAGEAVSPVSPLGSSHDNANKRLSKPMVYDQRLNPSALFANAEANGSRVSMQDQRDYSRPLGITNPDPRASLDSRSSHP